MGNAPGNGPEARWSVFGASPYGWNENAPTATPAPGFSLPGCVDIAARRFAEADHDVEMPIALLTAPASRPPTAAPPAPRANDSLISGGVDQRRALEWALSTRQAPFSPAIVGSVKDDASGDNAEHGIPPHSTVATTFAGGTSLNNGN
jgi:hypothetical protein